MQIFFLDDSYAELHTLSDASECSYDCCYHLRFLRKDRTIRVSFICTKGRLTTMNTMSIPPLELQTAYLADTLEMDIKFELGIEVSTTFWTGSAIVLAYIKNTTRRFQVSVSIIESASSIDLPCLHSCIIYQENKILLTS